MAEQVEDKRLEGISDIRDESDRNGMRIVIELKRDANPQVVLNNLFRYTRLQDNFSVNMLALKDGIPKTMTLREMLDCYIDHQRNITVRRLNYEKKKLQERAHILEGLKIACDHIDEVIKIIRSSANIPESKTRLMERFDLDDLQATAIVQMQLGKLSGLEIEKLEAELSQIHNRIEEITVILADDTKVMAIVKEEQLAIRAKYGDERRTAIDPIAGELDVEDLIPEENCVFTMTHNGYIKRVTSDTYRAQKRGGRGVTGMTTREEDYVEKLIVGGTHDYIFFFTNRGRVFRIKGYEIPEGSRQSKGMNIVNLLQLDAEEKVSAIIRGTEHDGNGYLTMCTRRGIIKRTPISEYNNVRKGGLRAIALDEGDDLVSVQLTHGNDTLFIGTREGMSIRFDENDARPMGRVTMGVRGIRLQGDDVVVGMELAGEGKTLLTVTEKGYGKRSSQDEYKIQARGGKGIHNYKLSDKTGKVVGIRTVNEDEDLMLISSDGIIIRMAAKDVSLIGRATQGVRLMKLADNIRIVNLATTEKEEDEASEEVTE
jgi:DNA gyrase subunit A